MYRSLDLYAINEAGLDFIIKYDGNYRMGVSAFGEEDGEE
jgi:hypothetical protein